jgi:hypothetical protein
VVFDHESSSVEMAIRREAVVEVKPSMESVQDSGLLAQGDVSQKDKIIFQEPGSSSMLGNFNSKIINKNGVEDQNFTTTMDSQQSAAILTVHSLQNDSKSIPSADLKQEQCEEDLKARQLLSAKRSLETNLTLILVSSSVLGIMIIVSQREFFSLIVFSALKGCIPILTTIVNFGTVRCVLAQYRDGLKQTLSQIFQNIILQLIC